MCFWVHTHVVKRYRVAMRSPKMQLNAKCTVGIRCFTYINVNENFSCCAVKKLTLINYEAILWEVLASTAAGICSDKEQNFGGVLSDRLHTWFVQPHDWQL